MITIYHNPRCRKSREGLAILENSNQEFEIVKYLDNHLDQEQLRSILAKLDIKPINLVRTNEAIWKSNYKDKALSDQQLIEIMIEHPKLIERPIVVNSNKAVVGRPAESILNIL
ncbi:arsenate reductase (glutaredoxin) [Winogradskyella sp. PE311]|uniref:arsenate reductase (glutaredoxin) n=1 Tax=Winogradskyella sp. PE311 TaxID=3366943 RepID=UPI00398186E4